MINQQLKDDEIKALDWKLIKRLFVFLKPYQKYVILALFITILTSALGPLRPYLTRIAIDKYIATSNLTGLLEIILLISGTILFHGVMQFLMTYLMQWVGQKVLLDIRLKLFDHIEKLNFRFLDKNPVGRLVTRVTNDIEGLNEMFSSGVVMIIADCLLIIWIVGFMFFINWQLSLIALSILPLLIVSTSIFRKKVRTIFRGIRLNVAKMNSFLNEYLSGISIIKLFNREIDKSIEFDSINNENRVLWVRTVFYYASFFPIIEIISTISLGIVIWYTAGNILSGLMTIGTLIAFLQYTEMFFRPIRDLTEKYTTLQSAMAAAEKIFDLLDTDDITPQQEQPSDFLGLKSGIEFKDVSFSYDGEKEVLKNINFFVQKGETVAIVGATGSGKSTLINLLLRFYHYDSGQILVDGRDIRSINVTELRSKISLVMQDVFLFSRSVSDNIHLGKDFNNDDIRKSALAVGADSFIEGLPNQYGNEVMERGSTLSSGQRQLISFARAYFNKPDILILDEATSNIDTETERLIESSLQNLLKDKTSIIIAHRLSTIKRANKIVVLHHGQVREIGTHKELLENGGIYSKLYNYSFKI
jgi:ATP-binding cassette subfamily B multidrug efflux pump